MSKCTDTLRDEYGSIRLSILKGKIKAKANNLNENETQQIVKDEIDALNERLKKEYGNDLSNEYYEEVDKALRHSNYTNIANYVDQSQSSDLEDIGDTNDAIKDQYVRSNMVSIEASGVNVEDLDILKLDKLSDLSRIFNNNIDALNKFIEKFNADILDAVLIANSNDENKISFASTNEELNKNISNWKNSIEFNGKELDDKILQEIAKYSNSNDVSNALLSSKNSELYKMFTKRNFDKLLKLTKNKIISTSGKGGDNYKFSIQSHMIRGWTNNEFIDFFDEIGSFSKTIMETRKAVKLVNKNGVFSFDISDSFNELDKMFYSINKLHRLIDRTDPLNSFDKAIKKVLKEKLVNQSQDSFYNTITNNDLSVYLGLYYNFLEKDNDLLKGSSIPISEDLNNLPNFFKASLNTFKNNSLSNSLDYLDVVIANIVKQTGNNYTQTVYDYDTKEFKIESLNSAKVNRAKFQLKSNIEIRINNLDFNTLIENLGIGFDYNGNDPIISYDNVRIHLNNNSFEINGNLNDSTKNKLKEFIHSFIPYTTSMNLDTFDDYLKSNKDPNNAIDYLLPLAIRSAYLLNNKNDSNEEISIDSTSGIINLNVIQKGLSRYSEFINHETGGEVKSITMSANDTALPSYGLINMINEPNTMISFINKGIKRNKERNNKLKRKRPNILENNFILQNSKDLQKSRINTFIVSGENINPIHKSYNQDVFFNNFVMEYLGNINSEGYNLVIQPTTFSDKSKQTAVVFNGLNTTAKWDNNTLLKALRRNTTEYYRNSIDIVRNDLIDVLESFGYSFPVTPSLSQLTYLFESKEFKDRGISIVDFHNRAQELGIEIIDQMHFEGGFKINSALKLIDRHDRYALMSSDFSENDLLYNQLIDHQMDAFISQLQDGGFVIDMELTKKTFEEYISRVNKIGYKNYDAYAKDWVDSKTNRLIFAKDNKINPILERYYLERALISESYQHLTVGSELSHKPKGAKPFDEAKGNYVEALSSNMAMRYIGMTKRAVAHQATMHPFQLGLFNGISYYEQIAFVQDPTMTLFNEQGSSTNQDVTDGASFSNMLSTILKNNSLLDQGGQIHHKSIGMLVDPVTGTAKLMKHADHNISNEKIRNSKFATYKLDKMIYKMLSKDFEYDIDLTTDFNGNNIFDDLNIRYKNENGELVKLNSFEKTGRNIYTINGNQIEIKNLYQLWKVLGGEYSVNNKKVYDDSSWYNLAEFVNRVGFYKNGNSLKTFTESNGIKYKDLRKLINQDRYDDDDKIEYIKGINRPTADSIYQPLKNKFISQVTFVSAFKVGASNVSKIDVLEDNDKPLNPTKWASIYTGLQLDHEHHTDDSELTEPTQSTAAIFFNGDAYQWNKQISTAMRLYVNKNIKDFFKTNKSLKDIDSLEIQQEINTYLSKELSKKDAVGFSINDSKKIAQEINKIVESKRKALQLKDMDAFNSVSSKVNESLALSDSGIYNIVVNSVNNLFTSLGIRRKLSGSANVQSPQTGFITVHNIDGVIKQAGLLTKEDIAKMETEIDLTQRISEIQLFDVVDLYDENGLVKKNYHLTDFKIYNKILKGEYIKVIKKPYGGRDLNPTLIKFTIGDNIARSFYTSDAGRLSINAIELSKLITKDKFDNDEEYNQALINRVNELHFLKDKYTLLMNRYGQKYDADKDGIDSIQHAIKNAIDNPSIGLSLNRRQLNVLKNLQLKTYADLKKGIYYTNEFDEAYGFDLGSKIEIDNYEEISSEVIMPAHMKSKFLIDDGVDVTDISIDYYRDKLTELTQSAKKGINAGIQADVILIEANGDHLYLMPESELPKEATLDKDYLGDYDNKQLLNSFNESIGEIGTVVFYKYKKNGKTYKLATYRNSEDIKKLTDLNDPKSTYVLTITSDTKENEVNLNSTAKELFDNFNASTRGAFSRTPGQAKQSIMSFKIVGFLHSERNTIYTSPYFLWLAGSDFDIDKANAAMFSFTKNGRIDFFSPYSRAENSDFILESMALPIPDGKEHYNEGKYSVKLGRKEFDLIMNYSDLDLKDFKKLSLLLHEISNKGYSFNSEINEIETKDLKYEIDFYFVEGANDPNLTKSGSFENAIVASLYHGINDARNIMHSYSPMDSDVVKTIAKSSPKGAKDHNMNHLNPLTDVTGMIVNSVGKDGISIAAVGLKGLSAIFDRLNKIKNGNFKNLTLNSDLGIRIDEMLGETGASTIIMPNGFDLKNMQDVMGDYLDQNFSQSMFVGDYSEFKDKFLRLMLDDADSSLELSELMTLSTDENFYDRVILYKK